MHTRDSLFGTRRGIGVLDDQALQAYLKHSEYINVIFSLDDNIFFFTDDPHFAARDLPDRFFRYTAEFPIEVTPSEIIPDGVVDTIPKFIHVFEKKTRRIFSVNELLDILNSYTYVSRPKAHSYSRSTGLR